MTTEKWRKSIIHRLGHPYYAWSKTGELIYGHGEIWTYERRGKYVKTFKSVRAAKKYAKENA
jgi:hypothetical protein